MSELKKVWVDYNDTGDDPWVVSTTVYLPDWTKVLTWDHDGNTCMGTVCGYTDGLTDIQLDMETWRDGPDRLRGET